MKKYIITISFLACLGISLQAQLIAFPGAEGFGKYAVGGRGGKVVAVTNLNDYTATETAIPGSLRWALSQYTSTDTVNKTYKDQYGSDSVGDATITRYTPLTIVFKVSGTIWLKEDLKVKRDSLTIAGQTAPGDGICIAGRSVLFNGATGGEQFYWGPCRRDVIIRYIRFRPGIPRDASGTPTSSFVTYGCDLENYYNVILDHCTMSWANEECLATYDTKNVTVQWCMVTEGLYNAYHIKGSRSYGGVWGGQFATYHHNIIAHNVSRTARFNGSRAHDTAAVIDYRNNVIYNWGNSDGPAGGEIDIPGGRSELNLINNYYKSGPAYVPSASISKTNKGHRIAYLYDAATPANGTGQHYINGNYTNDFPAVTANNWLYGVQFKYYSTTDTAATYTLFRLNTPSPEVDSVLPTSLESATDALTSVLANAGAVLPLRDAQDKRIVNEITNGTATGTGTYGANKGIIDDPAIVGGWPVLSMDTVPIDSDNDGMPNYFEIAHSLDPSDSTDGNNIAPSSYTWLEEYLNSITSNTTFLQAPFNLQASQNASSDVLLTWVDNSDLEENYEIQRAESGVNIFTTLCTLDSNTTSYIDTTVVINTTYIYKIRAINSSTQSAFSDTAMLSITDAVIEDQLRDLHIYIDPALASLTIEAGQAISRVELYSITGARIISVAVYTEQVSIPMAAYASGVYMVRIITQDGRQQNMKILK